MLTPIVITSPAALPVRVEAIKNFARVSTNADNALIESLIATATEQAELYTGLALISRTLQLTLDYFPFNRAATPWWNGTVQGPVGLLRGYPDPIVLPGTPLQSIVSITTYDEYDAETTVDPSVYRADVTAGTAVLNPSKVWPTNLRDVGAVQITYIAGFGDAASNVPQSICTAIMMQAQTMYDNRSVCEMCDGSKALLTPYRIMRL